jgi:hypothetical protein
MDPVDDVVLTVLKIFPGAEVLVGALEVGACKEETAGALNGIA